MALEKISDTIKKTDLILINSIRTVNKNYERNIRKTN